MLVVKVHLYVSPLVKVSDVPLYMLSHPDVDQQDTALVTAPVDQERLMDKAGQEILMEAESLLKTQTGRCGATPKS